MITLSPSSDVSSTNATPIGAASLYLCMDIQTPQDAEYTHVATSGNFVVGVAGTYGPGTNYISGRYRTNGPGGGAFPSFEIYEDGVLTGSHTMANTGGSFIPFQFTTTGVGGDDLRVKFIVGALSATADVSLLSCGMADILMVEDPIFVRPTDYHDAMAGGTPVRDGRGWMAAHGTVFGPDGRRYADGHQPLRPDGWNRAR